MRAVVKWRMDLESLLSFYPTGPGDLPQLIEVLGRAAQPPQSAFWPCQPVDVLWNSDGTWYPARVKKVHENGDLDVEFDVQDWWGHTVHEIPPGEVRARPCGQSRALDVQDAEAGGLRALQAGPATQPHTLELALEHPLGFYRMHTDAQPWADLSEVTVYNDVLKHVMWPEQSTGCPRC